MSTPRRVVVRGPNWLGDLVMAAPAIRAIGDAWPEATVDVAVPAGLAPIVAILDPRAGVVALEGRTGPGIVRRHAAQLTAGGYDHAILFTNSFASALVARLAGVPERWGYRRDARGLLLTRAIRPRATQRTSTHHADYYAALVEALGLPRPTLDLHALLPEGARSEAMALLRDAGWDGQAAILACAPGAAYGAAKQWPPRLVAKVAEGWIADGGVVVVVGAAADRPAAVAVASAMAGGGAGTPTGLIDLTARTSLLALAGVLGIASRVLANDSGAMHVAAALGTPTVSVFGPTREWATAPLGPHRILTHDVWCRPCMLRECPLDHRCMTGVAPDRVLSALRSGDAAQER